jgi:hypothetical protein
MEQVCDENVKAESRAEKGQGRGNKHQTVSRIKFITVAKK